MKRILLLLTVVFSLNATSQVVITGGPVTYDGFDFETLYEIGELEGMLTSVSLEATLVEALDNTYADDLAFYVHTELSYGGKLQIGGYSDLEAIEKYSWTTGGLGIPGTVVSGTINITPFDIAPFEVYLGNGFGGGGETTWDNITLTLNGVSETAASTNDFVSSKFSVYPNPANDVLNITNADFDIKQVGITDINGRAIKTIIQGVPSQETSINVSDLSAGIYFLVIKTSEGKAVKKFVKN